MGDLCPVGLAQKLVQIDTCGPHGDESLAAEILAPILREAGLEVQLIEMAPGRASIVADLRPSAQGPTRTFTGHLDTVPFARDEWLYDPLAGSIENGRLLGRGASDMKGGVAALVAAAVKAAACDEGGPVRLVLTAGEETGCEGAKHLAEAGHLAPAGLLIVAEPTANRAYLGHKGVLWLRLRLAGVAAHGSMPELGVNAVVKAAETTVALAALDFGSDEPHQLLGRSSVNVGFSRGGFNFNTVPSLAEIGVDLRISPPRESASLIEHIRTRLAHDVEIEEVLNLAPVDTESSNPWIQAIGDAAGRTAEQGVPAGGLPYFTDAAVLAGPLDSPPVVIIGPGDPELAHVANESCDIEEIRHAAELYFNIMQLPEPAALLSAGPEGFLIGSARSDLK